jgi:hypothetical protein
MPAAFDGKPATVDSPEGSSEEDSEEPSDEESAEYVSGSQIKNRDRSLDEDVHYCQVDDSHWASKLKDIDEEMTFFGPSVKYQLARRRASVDLLTSFLQQIVTAESDFEQLEGVHRPSITPEQLMEFRRPWQRVKRALLARVRRYKLKKGPLSLMLEAALRNSIPPPLPTIDLEDFSEGGKKKCPHGHFMVPAIAQEFDRCSVTMKRIQAGSRVLECPECEGYREACTVDLFRPKNVFFDVLRKNTCKSDKVVKQPKAVDKLRKGISFPDSRTKPILEDTQLRGGVNKYFAHPVDGATQMSTFSEKGTRPLLMPRKRLPPLLSNSNSVPAIFEHPDYAERSDALAMTPAQQFLRVTEDLRHVTEEEGGPRYVLCTPTSALSAPQGCVDRIPTLLPPLTVVRHELNMRNQRILGTELEAFTVALPAIKDVEAIDVGENLLTDYSLFPFVKKIGEIFSTNNGGRALKKLSLRNNRAPDAMTRLIELLPDIDVRELDVSGNELDAETSNFKNFGTAIMNHSTLQIVKLADCKMGYNSNGRTSEEFVKLALKSASLDSWI